jgi:NAD(P)-dependent dehydrogenase (short-subunit alcohol dehydrogenase family)
MNTLDKFRLDGKRALVTGASRGLGKAMARALADAGAHVIINGISPENLAAAATELRVDDQRVDTIQGDLSTPEEACRVAKEALIQFGPIDILINNVGGRVFNVKTEDLALTDWQKIIDYNITSTFLCTKILGSEMLKRKWGRVINTSSISGIAATRGMYGRSYETAKAAVIMFTRALAVDWAPYNVTVNTIAPGTFLTDRNKRWMELSPDLRDTIVRQIPMGRMGDPQEIGPLALFLASNASSFMTGAVLVIDGGATVW